MKRRISIILALVALALALGVAGPAIADSPGKLTGGIQFWHMIYDPDFNIVLARAWAEASVIEVEQWVDADGQTRNAQGMVRFRDYHESWGRRSAHLDVGCVEFGQDEGGRYAIFSAKIVKQERLDLPYIGTYWILKWYDNGTPGSEGDRNGYFLGNVGTGWTCDALCNPEPENGCPYYLEYDPMPGQFPYLETPVAAGNVVIHD